MREKLRCLSYLLGLVENIKQVVFGVDGVDAGKGCSGWPKAATEKP